MRSFAMACCLVVLALGCASSPPSPTPAEAAPAPPPKSADAASAPAPSPTRLEDPADRADGVGVFTSVPWTFDTNLYWIEGPEGVVVIDTLFLPREAERAIAHIEQVTQKPVVAAVVLHPNPDKFNGADAFRAHGARVVTSSQVLAHIPRVAEKRRKAFLQRYAPHYPAADPIIASFGDATTTLRAGGLEIDLHVLAQGCSDAHVVASWNGHVFVGDLVASGTHAWLELGYVREWLERLDDIERLAPRRVHPGRGPSGGVELVHAQRRYLERVLTLVEEAAPTMPPPDGAIAALKEKLESEYPSLGYPVFLYGMKAVWEREAGRRTQPE